MTKIPKNKISREGIIDNSINMLNTDYSVDEVLLRLLKLCQPIDLNKKAGLRSTRSLMHWQQVVIIIDEIIKIIDGNGLGILRHKYQIYIYNGMLWKQAEEEKLVKFVGEMAERMGINHIQARHFEYRNKLLQQLLAVVPGSKCFPKESTLINLANGTLEIDEENIKLRPFSKDDFITYKLPFIYDPLADATMFKKYLNRVLPQQELQDILSEYLGYLFVPCNRMKMEKSMLLYGSGANGKSVLFDIINALLGKENVSNFSLGKLTDRNGYYRAMIGDRLLNYSSEINSNLDPALFKQLVSGEPVEARLPYGKPFIIENYARLMFNTNELPRDVEHSHAYFRRFLIIPFEVIIPEAEQDHKLANKIIKSELSGIMNWVIEGLRRLIKNESFTISNIVEKEIEDYRRESDTCLLFIEHKNIVQDMVFHTSLQKLYDLYKQFCIENNYRPYSNRSFRKHLENYGFQTYKASTGVMVCGGVK